MDTISLEGLEFFAYHGYYREERQIGNKYQVDITIHLDLDEAAQKDKLAATINYETIYKMIEEEMRKPSKLLEHIAHRIIQQAYERFPTVDLVEVRVAKYNPPVGGVCKWARVYLKR